MQLPLSTTSDATLTIPAVTQQPTSPSLFDVWKEYEHIAIHFNDLILKLRIQALGGVAAISALAGLVVNEKVPAELRWDALGSAFTVLAAFWIALACLDLGYYSRLLQGAVLAILKLEALEGGANWPRPAISTTIEAEVRRARLEALCEDAREETTRAIWQGSGVASQPLWAPCAFYGIVLASLLVLAFVCFVK